ncbi:MAG: TRAP transporter large permease [Sphaerochaetaceae bacterium]
MDQNTIAITILLGSFFIMIFAGSKILFSIGISTLITILYLGLPVQLIAQNMVKGVNSFSLMSVPFFILAGEIMGSGGITKRLIKLSDALVGWIRGGLAMVNVAASMFFGGISGSPTADCSSIGAMLIPMMVDYGYDVEFSTNITMTSSIQSLLIPPSHNMVIYAMAAGGVSIGALFLAGAVPGILLGIALMIYSYVMAIKKNYPRGDTFNFKVALRAIGDAGLGLITVLIVVVGVVAGIFTATESAAIAVVYAFIITFFVYKEIPLKEFKNIVFRSIKTISIVMILVGISSAFGWLIAYLQVPAKLGNLIFTFSKNKFVVMLLINLFLLVVGTMMDMVSAILIVTPVLLPITQAIGLSSVQFGIIMILNLGIGLITPPVGVIIFVGSAISGVKIERLSKTLIPFYLVMVLVLFLVTYIPAISLTLPKVLMGV